MGYELVGQHWDAHGPAFRTYVKRLNLSWVAGITLHHTATPNLAQRPHGFEEQHLRNLRHHYQKKLGWSRGPHLFIDDHRVWGLSSLESRGVHAVSYNRTHLGLEVLGDYDHESPMEGRGLACWKNAASVVAVLLKATGLSASAVNFHRDDPRTSKTCPGKRVSREWVKELIGAWGQDPETTDDGLYPEHQEDRFDPDEEAVAKRLEGLKWEVRELEKELGFD